LDFTSVGVGTTKGTSTRQHSKDLFIIEFDPVTGDHTLVDRSPKGPERRHFATVARAPDYLGVGTVNDADPPEMVTSLYLEGLPNGASKGLQNFIAS
jgi:hypothetical protein